MKAMLGLKGPCSRAVSGFLLLFMLVLSTAVSAQNKVEIDMLGHAYKAWNDVVEKHIARYQAQNPNVKINFIPTPDYDTKMLTMFAAGKPPGIVRGPGQILVTMVESKWLDPAPYWAERDIRSNYIDVTVKEVEYKGRSTATRRSSTCCFPS